MQDPVGERFSSLYNADASLSAVSETELWSQDSRRSLSIGWSTEDGLLDGRRKSLRVTERLAEDTTLDGGLGALQRTERLTEDRGVLLKTGLLMEDVALDAGWDGQRRTELSTEHGALNTGVNARQKTERSTHDSKLDGRRSALRRTCSLGALLCLEPSNARRSSLSFVTRRSTLSSFLCS